MDEILTYWLTPTDASRSYFGFLIDNLAAQYDAPRFEPHVTIYVTRKGDEDAKKTLRAIGSRKPFRLLIRGISCSDKFAKTLFVEFEPSDQLVELSADFRRVSALQHGYELNPHLSLIYKIMPFETKAEIVRSIDLPFTEVLFDLVKAVVSPANIKSREDVEAWRVVATKQLSE